jgi:hypothetical protein
MYTRGERRNRERERERERERKRNRHMDVEKEIHAYPITSFWRIAPGKQNS